MITTAKGTLLKIGDGASPEVFTTIGQVRSIDGPNATTEIVDTTTHSLAGYWRSKLAVLIDPGNLTFDINWDVADATHAPATGLWALFIALTLRAAQCIFPNSAGQMDFDQYIASHAFAAPVDDVLMASIDMAINGAITFESA